MIGLSLSGMVGGVVHPAVALWWARVDLQSAIVWVKRHFPNLPSTELDQAQLEIDPLLMLHYLPFIIINKVSKNHKIRTKFCFNGAVFSQSSKLKNSHLKTGKNPLTRTNESQGNILSYKCQHFETLRCSLDKLCHYFQIASHYDDKMFCQFIGKPRFP